MNPRPIEERAPRPQDLPSHWTMDPHWTRELPPVMGGPYGQDPYYPDPYAGKL